MLHIMFNFLLIHGKIDMNDVLSLFKKREYMKFQGGKNSEKCKFCTIVAIGQCTWSRAKIANYVFYAATFVQIFSSETKTWKRLLFQKRKRTYDIKVIHSNTFFYFFIFLFFYGS
jgi:hypothetical protein